MIEREWKMRGDGKGEEEWRGDGKRMSEGMGNGGEREGKTLVFLYKNTGR